MKKRFTPTTEQDIANQEYQEFLRNARVEQMLRRHGLARGLGRLLIEKCRIWYSLRRCAPHERELVKHITSCVGGLNCSRCGYRTCIENAIAIVRGESPMDSCVQHGRVATLKIQEILARRDL